MGIDLVSELDRSGVRVVSDLPFKNGVMSLEVGL